MGFTPLAALGVVGHEHVVRPGELGAPAAKGDHWRAGGRVGHALETLSRYRMAHGEAVSIGMVAEARLAESMGLAESGISQQIASYLQNSGLPTRSVNLKPETIRAAMKADKQKTAGKLKFTLPKRIGEVHRLRRPPLRLVR